MPYYHFFWTDPIIAHVAENDVTPDEFEQVVCNPTSTGFSRSSGNPIAIGRTAEGRKLVCVYEMLDPVRILPVTAFEPEEE